jgi:hypothetical protein
MNNICEICGGEFNEIFGDTIRDSSYRGYKSHTIVYECTDRKIYIELMVEK